MVKAKWIWNDQQKYDIYNQTIIAQKKFNLEDMSEAILKITADSYYRLYINDEWINDGPCRSWPEHYQYDVLDITSHLNIGKNTIKILAKYWGIGNFHTIPKQAGLLAQIEIKQKNNDIKTIVTNSSWQVAIVKAYPSNTPKTSIQMEPQEHYDARLDSQLHFTNAKELFSANEGPWKDLNPRDVALLTKKSFSFQAFYKANILKDSNDLHFCVPTAKLVNEGVIEANLNTSNASGLAVFLEIDEAASIQFYQEGYRIAVDGKQNKKNIFELTPGKHLVLAFVNKVLSHRKETVI